MQVVPCELHLRLSDTALPLELPREKSPVLIRGHVVFSVNNWTSLARLGTFFLAYLPFIVCRLQEGIGENVDPDALALTYDNLTKRSFSLEMADAPKALADMVEALAGAVFVDSGFSLERVFEVCNDLK